MITTVKCDGCNKTLDEPSGNDVDLCSSCKTSYNNTVTKFDNHLKMFIRRFGTIGTMNAMNSLFVVLEKRLAAPPSPKK